MCDKIPGFISNDIHWSIIDKTEENPECISGSTSGEIRVGMHSWENLWRAPEETPGGFLGKMTEDIPEEITKNIHVVIPVETNNSWLELFPGSISRCNSPKILLKISLERSMQDYLRYFLNKKS